MTSFGFGLFFLLAIGSSVAHDIPEELINGFVCICEPGTTTTITTTTQSSSTTPAATPTESSSTTPAATPTESSSTTPGATPTESSSTTPAGLGQEDFLSCFTENLVVPCPPPEGSVGLTEISMNPYCTYTVYSPGFEEGLKYPNGPYVCKWQFKSNAVNGRVRVEVEPEDFKLEAPNSTGECKKDFVALSPLIHPDGQLLRQCGSFAAKRTYDSVGDNLLLKFKANNFRRYPGFKMTVIGRVDDEV